MILHLMHLCVSFLNIHRLKHAVILMSQTVKVPITACVNSITHWVCLAQPLRLEVSCPAARMAVVNPAIELRQPKSSATPNLTIPVKIRDCIIMNDSHRHLTLIISRSLSITYYSVHIILKYPLWTFCHVHLFQKYIWGFFL